MNTLLYSLTLSLLLIALPTVAAQKHKNDKSIELLTFKTPSCGCCKKWIDYMSEMDFVTYKKDVQAMSSIKTKYQIASEYQSCHTAVTRDGYAFEGHIPAKYITQFLDEKPANAIGLAVPGMPVGSPGMEVGERFQPYQVLILFEDGTSQLYAEISSFKDQF